MPEIAEVARLVHFLRQHLVGKKIAKVQAPDDANIFGKAGSSGPAFEKALTGRKVIEAGSQGKYFWLRLNDPGLQPVMHLGMTGWIHIQNARTAYTNYYKKMSPEEQEAWPPKFWKFQLETTGQSPVRVAFTDSRRFGRVRLVDCSGAEIRQTTPLVENGPDPVVDKDRFTEDYLRIIMQKRHVPVKALILDQAVISGIGNWVADESLYQAKLHPEQYCNEFSDEEIRRLYEAIRYVCQTAVNLLADSDQFPEHWLFNHRWGKGKKAPSALPSGEKLAFITVGGRTSCYAPVVQKKTGRLALGLKEEPIEVSADVTEAPKKVKIGKYEAKVDPNTKLKASKVRKATLCEMDEEIEEKQPRKKAKVHHVEPVSGNVAVGKLVRQASSPVDTGSNSGRRRSSRLSNRI